MKSQLPNLIIIGAMKCGTTSLHSYLNQHPDIYMSAEKELDYFVKEFKYDRGVEWYKTQFITDKKIRGESSQNYTKAHALKGVAKRIYNLIPDVKLIYLVRDPIKRLVSHHLESVVTDHETHSFIEFLGDLKDLQNRGYFLTGNYYYQISEYLMYFDKSQILVVSLEELEQNRLTTLNTIFDFLGIDRVDDDEIFNYIENKGDEKTVRNKTGEFLTNNQLIQLVKPVIPRAVKAAITQTGLYKKLIHKKTDFKKAVLDKTMQETLKNAVAEYINDFRELTGKKFEEWSV